MTVDSNGAALFVVPVDVLTVDEEGWGAGNVGAFADAHVETDLFGNGIGCDVGVKLVEIAFALSKLVKVFVEKGSAIGTASIFPFRLITEESVGIFLPITL